MMIMDHELTAVERLNISMKNKFMKSIIQLNKTIMLIYSEHITYFVPI